MQSFRTELENPLVEREIIELEQKIHAYKKGDIPEEKFRSLRLARGVYGQRQSGVQMVRIKLPFGKVTFQQLLKIADISDEYGSSNLHLTTRQDIQIHYVSLDRTPELWAKLAEDDITLREACGNTVRNVTASADAGVNPEEPFDVSPYAHTTFEYFLRNPICADMGRKFKMSFSANAKDSGLTFIHDLGFIPKVKIVDGQELRGFKVMLGGGLGAQPFIAAEVHDFLAEEELIPFIEAALRVFDRHGERNNRNKARLKYLVQKIGLDEVLRLIEEEKIANKSKRFWVDRDKLGTIVPPTAPQQVATPYDLFKFEIWKKTNVFKQKQAGYFGIFVKVMTGDISSDKARELVAGLRGHIADDIRITQNQGLLFKYVHEESLPHIFNVLHALGFDSPGFDSTSDVTTCPGTDTCNLGISNSTEMARVIENYIEEFYQDFVYEKNLKIKISGCMNSCGQHGLAHIGFHGASVKVDGNVLPAAQVMLGGGSSGDGRGRAAERVIKVPTKRVLQTIDLILSDFKNNKSGEESFHAYYDRQGKNYFYQLLKPLADLTTLTTEEYLDWGQQESFVTAIGVGECAGVIIDLVATLLLEAEEKVALARSAYENKQYADAIYHAYSTFVWCAKALLLDQKINVSTQNAVLHEFDKAFVEEGLISFSEGFANAVLAINKYEPSEEFARAYIAKATAFYIDAKENRNVWKEAVKSN